jgi:hypothetical protein
VILVSLLPVALARGLARDTGMLRPAPAQAGAAA